MIIERILFESCAREYVVSVGSEIITSNLLDFGKPEIVIRHFVLIIASRVGIITHIIVRFGLDVSWHDLMR